ncbi:MAG: Cell wall hydrolase/autolysin [Parcubacteria group bacterium GW2011_GWF2_38_76]|nr:MAG: Cell wall hydrolase/autolysin [Parcubacteria group bacterium GW2011_GWF2_38_76]
MVSSVFFVDSTTTGELKEKYNEDKKIKILLVPGHDSESGGTVFKNIKESELNLRLSRELYSFLSSNPRFEVESSRDDSGYNKNITEYMSINKASIEDFIKSKKNVMQGLLSSGDISIAEGVIHNTAPEEIAKRLYSINKWSNENNIDLVIHIHFNDHPGRKINKEGKYSGFSIYTPEKQFSNAKASRELADYILKNIDHFYSKSNMPKERLGVIEDQELIALGSYNTLDSIGLLIEYGYIYEPQFTESSTRNLIIKDMAYQTYLGITDFFDKKEYLGEYWKSTLLPHSWSDIVESGDKGHDILSLQVALVLEGFYPPKKFLSDDCPVTGIYKRCTTEAVKEFQKRYKITTTGRVGPKTMEKLNQLYSKVTSD